MFIMEKLLIGHIGKPFGLKGEIKVTPLTSFIKERYCKGRKVLIENPKTKESFEDEIISVRLSTKQTIIKLSSISNIGQAETLYGYEIYMDKNDAPMPKGSYRIADLLGCKVVDEDGTELGIVKDVLTYAPKSSLRVGREKSKDFFVPFVDDYLIDVDIENKTIKIKVVPGML